MPKYIRFLLVLVALFLVMGCTGQETINRDSAGFLIPSGQVPVASVEGNHAEISKSTYNRMVGDTLYFIDSRWDEEEKKLKNISVCRLQRGSEKLEILTDLGDAELISFFADETKAVYCFYTESEEETEKFYLRKMNQDKEVAYDVEVSYEGISGGEGPLVRIGTVAAGEADREGKVCLAGTQGDLYLFNEEGQIVRIEKAPWDGDTYNGSTCGLVNAGENGIYTWLLNGRKLSLQKVNMENGTLGKVIEVNVEGTPNVTLTLYNGYDHGILIDDSDSLWCYLPGQGAPEHILNWGDSTIGLKQYTIDAIGVLENKSLYIAAHRPSQDITLVNISNKDALEITETPEIQVVTVGILKQYEKVMELSLNKEIEEYKEKTGHQAELCSYDSVLDLELALVRGEGPDIICLGLFGLDADILAAKGVLEDLEPYFEMSSNLKMEDLLLAVREAGTINEKFRCVIESFAISGALVKEGITDNGSWTVEDYIKLGEENPDIPLSLAYGSNKDWYRTSVLDYILEWNRMWYVDWKEKKCYFDSVNFVSLLERISRLEIHWNENEDYGVKKEDYMERVFQQQELVGEWSVGDPSSFVYYMEAMDTEYGSLELAGYPSQEKGPYCRLKAIMSLGINSASLNKDRAWQFLAFLLSEDHQKEISSNIPVRSDSFENFLNTEKNGVCLSENEKELFRYLVEHAHWKANSLTDKILSIIHEEVAPVWAGDRTAEQAANIIQNRVSVYLNE